MKLFPIKASPKPTLADKIRKDSISSLDTPSKLAENKGFHPV